MNQSEATILLQKELEAALQTKLQLSGQHVFYNRSSSVPNPILQLPHLGTIGLPLSSSFAEFIIKSQTSSPFVRNRPTDNIMAYGGNYSSWEVDPNDVSQFRFAVSHSLTFISNWL